MNQQKLGNWPLFLHVTLAEHLLPQLHNLNLVSPSPPAVPWLPHRGELGIQRLNMQPALFLKSASIYLGSFGLRGLEENIQKSIKQQASAVDLSSSVELHHFPAVYKLVPGEDAGWLAGSQGAASSAHHCNPSSPLPQAPLADLKKKKKPKHVKYALVFVIVYKRKASSLSLLQRFKKLQLLETNEAIFWHFLLSLFFLHRHCWKQW